MHSLYIPLKIENLSLLDTEMMKCFTKFVELLAFNFILTLKFIIKTKKYINKSILSSLFTLRTRLTGVIDLKFHVDGLKLVCN